MIAIELMLPFNGWFRIFFLQILKAVVYQLAMISYVTHPAEQLGLFEVLYVPQINFSIKCGAPLFAGLQVNQPYFMIVFIPYNNLLQADHLNINMPAMATFYFLPKQGFSVAVSVKKKYRMLSKILNVLLSSLLVHQNNECVVEGSERIVNVLVLLFETDRERFLLKHRIQSIK